MIDNLCPIIACKVSYKSLNAHFKHNEANSIKLEGNKAKQGYIDKLELIKLHIPLCEIGNVH